MTLMLFLLVKRSEAYRDAIERLWLSSSARRMRVKRKWYAPLRGKEIAWIIVILSIIADILGVLDVLWGWFGLLSGSGSNTWPVSFRVLKGWFGLLSGSGSN